MKRIRELYDIWIVEELEGVHREVSLGPHDIRLYEGWS